MFEYDILSGKTLTVKTFFNNSTTAKPRNPAVVTDYLQDGCGTSGLSLRSAAAVTFSVFIT